MSTYSHMGTHIDGLNRFGLNGKIWNGFRADGRLGDRGWRVGIVQEFPPIVARGALIDVATRRAADMPPSGHSHAHADPAGVLIPQARCARRRSPFARVTSC